MKMKWMLITLVGITMAACGGEDTDKKEEKKDKKEQKDGDVADSEETTDANAVTLTLDETLDLSKYEMPLKIKVPAGTQVDEKSYGLYIKNGDGFNFEPNVDFWEDVAERKAKLEENDLNKLKKYIIDNENGYVAETEVMDQTEYHVFYLIKGDGFTLSMENVKGRSYSKAEAEFMWKAFETAEVLPMSK